MTDTKTLFSLAEADDVVGLTTALGETESFRIRNDNGETLFLFSLYRGRSKCVEALKARGGLTLQEAAAAGDVARIEACIATAPWTVQSLSADGWPALHLAAFLGHDAALVRLLELGADARQWARGMEANLAIHAAAAGRRLGREAFAKLVAATGDPDVPQKQGYTASMIAAANGFGDAIDVLLAAGADRARRQGERKSAADFARERGHAALAERLS